MPATSKRSAGRNRRRTSRSRCKGNANFRQTRQREPRHPSLLIVSDMRRIELHTNWTNMVQEKHVLELVLKVGCVELELLQSFPKVLAWTFVFPRKATALPAVGVPDAAASLIDVDLKAVEL